jgi:pyridoxine kinase
VPFTIYRITDCGNKIKCRLIIYNREIVNEYFHGTGDCFASALVAAITSGKRLEEASKFAVDFTVDAILQTIKYPNIDKKYGVCFEEALKGFISRIDE